MKERGSIKAIPNPIPIDDYSDTGVTTLAWEASAAEATEVHVDAPDGQLLSRSGPSGSATTGKWVTSGMSFYLQDASPGKALVAANTLDVVTIYLSRSSFAPPLAILPDMFVTRTSVFGSSQRVLVTGWFSFENAGATAGDLLARDVACDWLASAGCRYDVALADSFPGGVNWRSIDPRSYSHVVFVCGPFGKRRPSLELLDRFIGCQKVGLNLSMIEPLQVWNPFDFLLERDSSAFSRPDISFASNATKVPVVGVILTEPTPVPEYKERAQHGAANNMIRGLLASREMSIVEIDTRLQPNATGLRSAAEVESLIARMDVVVTTRLHGMVLAIKNSVPAIAIDCYAGGDKIVRQADAIGWPVVFTAGTANDEQLREALAYGLTEDARKKAADCADRALDTIQRLRDEFIRNFCR